MVVCHCHRVNDRTIAELAALYDASIEEICGRSGAGTNCGGCRQAIHELVATAPSAGTIGPTAAAAGARSSSFRGRRSRMPQSGDVTG